MRAFSSAAAISSSSRVRIAREVYPGAAASTFTSRKVSTVCGLPSSTTSKSACVRSVTGIALLVGDDDVDANEVDAGAEHRLAGGVGGRAAGWPALGVCGAGAGGGDWAGAARVPEALGPRMTSRNDEDRRRAVMRRILD